jgi:thiamine biosynthesis lipoprotein ApbE
LAGEYLVRSSGTLIDLGGIGKGWAADQAVEMGLALVVSAGGDIRSSTLPPRCLFSIPGGWSRSVLP